MKRNLILKGSIFLFAIATLFGTGFSQNRAYTFNMPDGWTRNTQDGTVASAWSPDKTAQVTIKERNIKDITALRYLQDIFKDVSIEVVYCPPSDMPYLKTRFSADSVARMIIIPKRPNDKIKYKWRVYALVKGNLLILIEILTTRDSPKELYNQAEQVILSFKFSN